VASVPELLSLLRDNPSVNVNWADNVNRWTALHSASRLGHSEVVKTLLTHPHINVNQKDKYGQTPLSRACENGKVTAVWVLLKDPRVDVTLDDLNERTPLWHASHNGHHEVIEWLIASGRDLGDIKKKGKSNNGREFTALEIARRVEKTKVVDVLESFLTNSTQTRREVRVKHGVLDELAAEVFALTVFQCDDLLSLKPALALTTSNPAAVFRFFIMASKLPMELQMVLCHRAVGSMRQNILHKDSEAAFKHLATILLSSQSN